MSSPIATAFVEIRGETSKLGPDVVDSVQKEMVKSGKAISDAIVKPINEASKTTSSIFAGIGQSIKNAMQPATQHVQNFTSGFKSAEAAASAATGRMGSFGGAVRTALQPAIAQIGSFTSGFRSSEAAASAFSGRMGTLGGVVGSTFRGASTVARDFGNVGSQIASRIGSEFSTTAANMQARFASSFASIKAGALGIGAALGVGGIGALIGAGFSRLSDIEQTTKSLQVMTGSASKAKDVMNDLLTFAKTTPFAFPDVSEIGRNLVAFGVDTEKVVPILKSLGDAASASGQGVPAMQSLGNAIGSVAIQGKISGQDLQSFQAVGVPALKILANTAGVSADEMSKRISKGTVDSKFAIDSLVKGIENGTNGLAGATAKMGGIMASQKDTIAGTMDSLKSSVTSTMATLLEPTIPAFRSAVNTFGAEFKKIPAALATAKAQLTSLGFFDALRSLFSGIGAIISGVLPLIQGFARGFMTVFGAGLLVGIRALGAAFQWVGGIIQAWRPVLQPIITILGALWGATALIRGAMLAGGAAMLIWHGIMVAFGPVMKIITALQWAFDAAMDANPITLIILAIIALVVAFVILWNKSAAFRDFWIGIWNAIKTAFTAVVDALKVAFNAIITAAQAVGDAFVTAWNAIKDAINVVWTSVIQPVFNALVTAVQAVGAAARWLWVTILQPVLSFIGAAIIIMGKIMLGLVLIPIVAFWKFVLAPAILWVWHTIFEPAFQGIGAIITFVWQNVIKPQIDAFVWFFTVAIPAAINFVWGVIQTVWNAIGVFINFVWINGIKPQLDAVVYTFTVAIPGAARWLWGIIQFVWNAISSFIGFIWINGIKPQLDAFVWFYKNVIAPAAMWLWQNVIKPVWDGISTIISIAWNKGIKPAFEAIKDGIHKVGDVFSSVKDFIGRVWDNLGTIAMKPIRFIVNTVLDDGLIAGWNKVVDFLKLGFLHIPPIPRLATGGIIPGYTPGVDNHIIAVGGGEAVMRPEWTRAAGAGYVNRANQAARTGGVSGASAFIAQNGLPGFALGGIIDSIGNFFKGTVNGIISIGGTALNFLTDPIGGIQKLLDSIIGGIGLGGLGDIGNLSQLVTQAPKALIGGMVQKIRDWWNSSGAAAAGGGGGAGGAVNTSGFRGNNRNIVMQIFSSLFGWGDPGNMAALDYLMMRESGYNNLAQNPTSTAFGMFQFLNSTWGGYGIPKTSDPAQQAVAGGRYIKARYGNPFGAAAHERAFNWYKLGGIPLFDSGGGLPRGLSIANNQSGRVETIHDPNVDDQILTTLQTISTLLERRPILGVTVAMDGHVIQKYFQEAEILGGL